MHRFIAGFFKPSRSMKGLVIVALLAAAAASLPTSAHATVVATFTWVPIGENPPAQITTPGGTLQLTLSSFNQTGVSNPPNFGPYFASGAATIADITAFSYTAGNGLTVSLADVTARSLQGTVWATSGLDIPASGAQAPSAPTQGNYLISAFTLSGTTAQGSSFMIANNVGTAGAMYANGIGNGTNTFNAASAIPAITDSGYWKLASMTSVPLPAALPLLLSGITGLMLFARRRRVESLLSR